MTTTMEQRRVYGDWLIDGFLDHVNYSRYLEIVIVDGVVYDAELYGLPEDAGRVTARRGELLGWGSGVSFAPDEWTRVPLDARGFPLRTLRDLFPEGGAAR